MILKIICTVFKRHVSLRRLIDCFVLQTDGRWELHIVHDGEPTPEILDVMKLYNDPRILFESTPEVNGNFGHSNRKLLLSKLTYEPDDYLLITNDDNMYVPKFVEYFLSACNPSVGLVFCDTVHSYLNYQVLQSRLQENYIDMGSFIVRLDVAKKIGFNHTHLSADGAYAVECATECARVGLKRAYINRPFFIHC